MPQNSTKKSQEKGIFGPNNLLLAFFWSLYLVSLTFISKKSPNMTNICVDNSSETKTKRRQITRGL